jgi:hypothetical protein
MPSAQNRRDAQEKAQKDITALKKEFEEKEKKAKFEIASLMAPQFLSLSLFLAIMFFSAALSSMRYIFFFFFFKCTFIVLAGEAAESGSGVAHSEARTRSNSRKSQERVRAAAESARRSRGEKEIGIAKSVREFYRA